MGLREIRAVPRAAVLLAVVLDVRGLAKAVRRITAEPRVESLEIEGVPVDLVRPGRHGPWPCWVFVTGAHPERRREPVVQRLAHGLARSGYVCLVPDLPGLGEGKVGAATLQGAHAVIRAALERPDVLAGRIALCGASTGAGLAVIAAGHPELSARISVVAAVTPYAHLTKIVCLATTARYAGDGVAGEQEQQVTALLRRAVARSLCATLPDARERDDLLARLADESDEIDPLEPFVTIEVTGLSPAARAIVQLLRNRDHARFQELFEALPSDVHSLLATLSPLSVAADVRARVEIVVPPTDIYFPIAEARALASELPDARLTVTATLDHTRPTLSLRSIPDLLRFQGFVVRGLARAL